MITSTISEDLDEMPLHVCAGTEVHYNLYNFDW